MSSFANGILRVFVNVSMANSHDGLSALAKKYEIDTQKLERGDFVIFLNKSRNRIKVYGADQVVAYQRAPHGMKLDLRAIAEIPRVFARSGSLHFDDALRTWLQGRLVKKGDSDALEVFAQQDAA